MDVCELIQCNVTGSLKMCGNSVTDLHIMLFIDDQTQVIAFFKQHSSLLTMRALLYIGDAMLVNFLTSRCVYAIT